MAWLAAILLLRYQTESTREESAWAFLLNGTIFYEIFFSLDVLYLCFIIVVHLLQNLTEF